MTWPWVSTAVPVSLGRTQTPIHPMKHRCSWAGMGDSRGRGEAGFGRVQGELALAPTGHPTEERCPQGHTSSPHVPAGLGRLHPMGAGGHYGVASGQDLAPGNHTQSQARVIRPPSCSEACDVPSAHPLLHHCSPRTCAAGHTTGPSLCKLISDIQKYRTICIEVILNARASHGSNLSCSKIFNPSNFHIVLIKTDMYEGK